MAAGRCFVGIEGARDHPGEGLTFRPDFDPVDGSVDHSREGHCGTIAKFFDASWRSTELLCNLRNRDVEVTHDRLDDPCAQLVVGSESVAPRNGQTTISHSFLIGGRATCVLGVALWEVGNGRSP